MTMYWCFRLGPVARRVLYLEHIRPLERLFDVHRAIEQFRLQLPGRRRPARNMPM